MNRLSTQKRTAILASLCGGASVSATARIVGVSKVTVLKLLTDIGPVCLDYQRRTLVNLPCTNLRADEVWSFVGCKGRSASRDEKGQRRDDVWSWAAICADTKLVPCFHVGARDADAAFLFMEDLASRLSHRVRLATDGHRAYLRAVEGGSGWSGIDYAMLVRLYGQAPERQRGDGPPEIVGTETDRVIGNPDPDQVPTSYVARQDLTMRMNVRRLTQLTSALSKKLENHKHALALHYMYYSFCWRHKTLTKARRGLHTTPAMAAGVADHVWTLEDVVRLLESKEAEERQQLPVLRPTATNGGNQSDGDDQTR